MRAEAVEKPPSQGSRASSWREQILREAAECLATRGFASATTREPAARVGIGEAALDRHFPGKQAPCAAIVDERIPAPVVAPLGEAARAGDDGVRRGDR